ncbi:hypothetical protein B0H13DRAFT_2309440 [Mycena leptocephala]|nr:hypothetical protein B0H13DRAFT_2309440 [Mycena leptocephala]
MLPPCSLLLCRDPPALTSRVNDIGYCYCYDLHARTATVLPPRRYRHRYTCLAFAVLLYLGVINLYHQLMPLCSLPFPSVADPLHRSSGRVSIALTICKLSLRQLSVLWPSRHHCTSMSGVSLVAHSARP